MGKFNDLTFFHGKLLGTKNKRGDVICDKIHHYGYGDDYKGIDIGKYVNRYDM